MVHFAPESVVHFTTESVVHFAAESWYTLLRNRGTLLSGILKETKKPGLKLISEGEFYPVFIDLIGKAKLKVRNALRFEQQDQLSSFIYYKEAYEAYKEIDELIDEKAVAVNWTKLKTPLSWPYRIIIFVFTAIIIPVVISILFPCNILNKVIIFCSTIFN